MKYDLLLSDMVAYIVGFLGLIASVIALQNAVSDAMSGSMGAAAAFALLCVVFFLPSRRFLMSRPYQKMIARAWQWQRRIPFVILNSVWVFLVTAFLLATKPDDLFGVASYVPWLFSPPAALVVWLLFATVFILPGLAFRPIRQAIANAPEGDAPVTPGVITRMRQNQNAILIDAHPKFETALKVADLSCAGFIVLCLFAFLFSDTHASLAYLEQASDLIWPTALLLFLCIYLPKNYGTRIVVETGDILYSAKRKLANACAALALGFVLAHMPYFYMLPWVYNKAMAEDEAEIAYQIAAPVNHSFCRHGLSFFYPENPEKTFRVCNISPDLRARVSAGDTVFVRGKISRYGHSAEVLRVRGQTTGA